SPSGPTEEPRLGDMIELLEACSPRTHGHCHRARVERCRHRALCASSAAAPRTCLRWRRAAAILAPWLIPSLIATCRSRGGQLDLGQVCKVGLGHRRLKIGVVSANDNLEAGDRNMDI